MNKQDLTKCYTRRFSKKERSTRNKMWQTLCSFYLQKFVKRSDTVMDIGAGYCEFINNIKCKKKIAVDINPDTKLAARPEVNVISANILGLPQKLNASAEVVFASNFLEHLKDRDEVVKVLDKINKLLKSNGKFLLLQPNIDLIKERYWDFIDHKAILNTRSIIESLELAGFKVNLLVERFLPYTTKNIFIPMFPILLKIYLLLPERIRPFPGQTFVVARKSK